MDKSLKDAIETALTAERQRGIQEGMDKAVGAINRGYEKAMNADDNASGLRDFTTWEWRDWCIAQIEYAQAKLTRK